MIRIQATSSHSSPSTSPHRLRSNCFIVSSIEFALSIPSLHTWSRTVLIIKRKASKLLFRSVVFDIESLIMVSYCASVSLKSVRILEHLSYRILFLGSHDSHHCSCDFRYSIDINVLMDRRYTRGMMILSTSLF